MVAYRPTDALLTNVLPIDRGEVDAELDAIVKGCQGAKHVVTIQPQVECKVVSRAGWDDHKRDAVPGGTAGDDGLGAVAAGHPNHISAAINRILGQTQQVVTAIEDDRFDPMASARSCQVISLRFATSGHGVHDQHRTFGWCGRSPKPRQPADGSTRMTQSDSSTGDRNAGEQRGDGHITTAQVGGEKDGEHQPKPRNRGQRCKGSAHTAVSYAIPGRSDYQHQSNDAHYQAAPVDGCDEHDVCDSSRNRDEGNCGGDPFARGWSAHCQSAPVSSRNALMALVIVGKK
jgi:hypothetical protein